MASSPEKQKDCASVGNKRSYGGVESVSPKSGHNQADQAVRVSTSLATGRGLKVGQSGKGGWLVSFYFILLIDNSLSFKGKKRVDK